MGFSKRQEVIFKEIGEIVNHSAFMDIEIEHQRAIVLTFQYLEGKNDKDVKNKSKTDHKSSPAVNAFDTSTSISHSFVKGTEVGAGQHCEENEDDESKYKLSPAELDMFVQRHENKKFESGFKPVIVDFDKKNIVKKNDQGVEKYKYWCCYCNESFETKYTRAIHVYQKLCNVKKKANTSVVCLLDDTTYKSYNSFYNHVRLNHKYILQIYRELRRRWLNNLRMSRETLAKRLEETRTLAAAMARAGLKGSETPTFVKHLENVDTVLEKARLKLIAIVKKEEEEQNGDVAVAAADPNKGTKTSTTDKRASASTEAPVGPKFIKNEMAKDVTDAKANQQITTLLSQSLDTTAKLIDALDKKLYDIIKKGDAAAIDPKADNRRERVLSVVEEIANKRDSLLKYKTMLDQAKPCLANCDDDTLVDRFNSIYKNIGQLVVEYNEANDDYCHVLKLTKK